MITLTGARERRMLDHMESTWKNKPELTARCPRCKEVFPLGYNYCPDCGTGLVRPDIVIERPKRERMQ